MCVLSPGDLDTMTVSIEAALTFFSQLFRVDTFMFYPTPFILFLFHMFSSLSHHLPSPVSLPWYQSAVFTHYFLMCFLFLLLSPPDNDRAKECQSDGRRLIPGKDACRTRPPSTRSASYTKFSSQGVGAMERTVKPDKLIVKHLPRFFNKDSYKNDCF